MSKPMSGKVSTLALAVVLSAFLAGAAEAGFDLGIVFSDEGVSSFHLAVGEYYGVPSKSVKAAKKGRVRDDELPVVFFLASSARVSSGVIVELRLGGLSWMEIMVRHRLSPEVLYVDVGHGPPYGKAWGYYGKPRKQWKRMKFRDEDVVNLVNLRFVSRHYGFPPSEVMKMRDKGEGFIDIQGKAKKAKKEREEKEKEKEQESGDKGGGQGKGKEKEK